MKIIYRIAEKQNKVSGKIEKIKPEWVNNQSCLFNAHKYKSGAELIVFGDRLDESEDMVRKIADKYIKTKSHGNAATLLEVLRYAIDNFDTNEIVYFLEDDYIHQPKYVKIIEEGFNSKRVDYLSLYDHPDKYGNREILFHTESTHWKYVPSTTMSFATTIKALAYDLKIFEAFCEGQEIPPDHSIFTALTGTMYRRLATPIPGYATHGETKWMSPCVKWERFVK